MNHVLFWNCMAKNGTAIDPKGALIKAIDKVLRFARAGAIDRERKRMAALAARNTPSAPAACRCGTRLWQPQQDNAHQQCLYGKRAYTLAPMAYTRIEHARARAH